MNASEAHTALRNRGYSAGQAVTAVREAAGSGTSYLHRHAVVLLADGSFQISPRPWADNPGAQVLSGETHRIPLPAPGSIALNEVLEIIEKVDAWLDGAVADTYRGQPLAQDWARTAKVTEETGEAREELAAWRQAALDEARVGEIGIPAGRSIAALIAVTGQNPRKGVHGTREALLKELADVVCTGLFAIQHFTKDADVTWAVIAEALHKARSRVPAESPFPPESGMTRQDAIDNGIIG